MRSQWMRRSFVLLVLSGPCDDFGWGPCEEEYMAPEASVTGTVKIDGVETPGVTVTVDGGLAAPQSVQTDRFGRYNLAVGGYLTPKVKVTPPAGTFFDALEREVNVTAPSQVVTVDFAGYHGAMVIGRVTMAGGTVVPDLSVRMEPNGVSLPTYIVWSHDRRTDAGGEFSFGYWPPGNYELRVDDPTLGVAFSLPGPFTLVGGQDRRFDITGELFVHGQVTANAVNLAGVTVTAVGPAGTFTTLTGSDGRYRIQDARIRPGLYTIAISGFDAALYRFTAVSDTATLALRAYRNYVSFLGRIANPPVVTIAAPADGATFAAGVPIELRGSALDPEDGAIPGTGLSWYSSLLGVLGTGATLTTSNLLPGAQSITLNATDSDGAVGSATIRITITASAVPGSISGRLTANGFAYGGATVTLSGAASATTITDGNGNYSFQNLSPGTYTVTISNYPQAFRFPATSQTVTLAPGQNLTVDFAGTYNSAP